MNQGRCLCGSVRYEIDGPVVYVVHCHCSMCRKHHGAGFVTWAVAPASGFRITAGADAIRRYESSPGTHRAFCSTCGSVTPELAPSGEHVIAPAANLEGDLPAPQLHMFVASKADWYQITDGLPQHEQWPAEYGMVPAPYTPPVAAPDGIRGSCLCGDVAFTIDTAPMGFYHCHCSRCRLARGAAHASNLMFAAEGFHWSRGAERVVTYRVPEAQRFGVAFCDRCGSSLPRVAADRGVAVVPAGSLDSAPGLRAVAHIFVASKADWDVLPDDGLPRYDAAPPRP